MRKITVLLNCMIGITTVTAINAIDQQLTDKIVGLIAGGKLCVGDFLEARGTKTPVPLIQNLAAKICLGKLSMSSPEKETTRVNGIFSYGKHELPTHVDIKSVETGREITVTIEGPITLATLIEPLAVLDKTFLFSNPSITFPADENASALILNAQLNLASAWGAVQDMPPLLITVKVPKGHKSAKDLVTQITLAQKTAKTICLDKLLTTFPGGKVKFKAKTLEQLLGSLCMDINHMQLSIAAEDITFRLDGQIHAGTKTIDANLFFIKKSEGMGLALQANLGDEVVLGKLIEPLKAIDTQVTLSNATLIIATSDLTADQLAEEDVPAGILLRANVLFKNQLQKIFKQVPGKLIAHIRLPLDFSEVSSFEMSIKKDLDKPIVIGPLTINDFAFLAKGGVPTPEIGLQMNADFTMPGTTNSTMFALAGNVGAETISLEGKAKCRTGKSQKACTVINEPFGLPFTITNPELKIYFAAGVLSGLGISGQFSLGKSDLTLISDVNLAEPLKSIVDAQTKRLCLTDIMALWQWLLKKSGTDKKIPNISLPAIGCFRDSRIDFKMQGGKIPDTGLDVNFDILGAKAHATGQLDVTGLTLQGNLEPIAVGSLFSLKSKKDTSKGPAVGIDLNFGEQAARLDGQISMLGGLITRNTLIDINRNGLAFELDESIAGLAMHLALALPLSTAQSFGDWRVKGSITNGLVQALETAITSAKNDAKTLENKCNKLPNFLSKTCKAAGQIATGIEKTLNPLPLLEKISGAFGVKSATFEASLADLQKGILPRLTIVIKMLGKEITLDVDQFNLHDIKGSASQLVNKIIAQIH